MNDESFKPQPLERLAQVRVFVAVDRIQPAEHHRLRIAVAGERLRGSCLVGHGLTDLGFADVLDAGDQIPDLARAERGDRSRRGQTYADLLGVVILARD